MRTSLHAIAWKKTSFYVLHLFESISMKDPSNPFWSDCIYQLLKLFNDAGHRKVHQKDWVLKNSIWGRCLYLGWGDKPKMHSRHIPKLSDLGLVLYKWCNSKKCDWVSGHNLVMKSLKLDPRVKVSKEESDSSNLTLGPSGGDSITKMWPETQSHFLLLHHLYPESNWSVIFSTHLRKLRLVSIGSWYRVYTLI